MQQILQSFYYSGKMNDPNFGFKKAEMFKCYQTPVSLDPA